MEVYLPMEKCIRTRVVVNRQGGIKVYQVKRGFISWKEVEMTAKLITKLSRKLKQINSANWGCAIKER